MMKSQFEVCGPITTTALSTPCGVFGSIFQPKSFKIKNKNFPIAQSYIFPQNLYLYPMQLEFRSRRVLPILLSLVLLWGLFLISALLLEQKENRNRNYVPADYQLVARMDTETLFRSVFYTLVFEARDPEVFGKLGDFSTSKKDSRKKAMDLGIDYLSDVLVFTIPGKENPVYGVLFNLSDADKFRTNFPGLLTAGQVIANDAHVGLLLTLPEKNPAPGMMQQLKARAEKIIAHPGTIELEIPEYKKNKPFLTLQLNETAERQKQLFKSGKLEAQLAAQALFLNGNFKAGTMSPVQPANWTLKPQGFHLSNALFTPEIEASLQELLISNGFELPEISRFSLNYKGIQLQDGESGLMLTPRVELLLEFRSDFSMTDIFEKNRTALSKIGTRYAGNTLQAGNLNFVVDSLDPHTLFIGMDRSLVLSQKNEAYFLLQGNIEELTHIEGGGFIRGIIEVLPPFRASQNLFQAIQHSDVQLRHQNGNILLTGEIRFKKDKYVINELLKFLLTFQG